MPTLNAVRNLYITLSSAVIQGFVAAVALTGLLDFSDDDNSGYLALF